VKVYTGGGSRIYPADYVGFLYPNGRIELVDYISGIVAEGGRVETPEWFDMPLVTSPREVPMTPVEALASKHLSIVPLKDDGDELYWYCPHVSGVCKTERNKVAPSDIRTSLTVDALNCLVNARSVAVAGFLAGEGSCPWIAFIDTKGIAVSLTGSRDNVKLTAWSLISNEEDIEKVYMFLKDVCDVFRNRSISSR